jgi:hypothetical protein
VGSRAAILWYWTGCESLPLVLLGAMTYWCSGCGPSMYDPSGWILLLITVGAILNFIVLALWKLNPTLSRMPVRFAKRVASPQPPQTQTWYWNPLWRCAHTKTSEAWPIYPRLGCARICQACGIMFLVRR